MVFSYTVTDKVVKICETQVESLTDDLKRECEARIGILVQKATEQAMRTLSADGKLDTSKLVLDAGMKALKV